MRLIEPYKPGHPALPAPSKRAILAVLQRYGEKEGCARLNAAMKARNDAIRDEERDPFRCGFELAPWKMADVLIGVKSVEEFLADPAVPQRWKDDAALVAFLRRGGWKKVLLLGGNRSSKTEYMSKRAVQAMLAHPDANLWMFHHSANMSVRYHQVLINKYLPPELRNVGKGKRGDPTYIAYTPMTGFSSAGGLNALMMPNGAVCEFRNYQQDVQTIEGGDLGSADRQPCLGAICDELCPLEWHTTLDYRCATRGAVMLNGFTPVEGYSDLVADFLDGAKPVYCEEQPEDVIADPAKRNVPMLLDCKDPAKVVMLFHTHYNPYGNVQEVLERAKAGGDDRVLERVFGWPTRRVSKRFATFDPKVHVVRRDALPKAGTVYQIVDPAGRKNWVAAWVLVDAWGRFWVIREFPSQVEPVPGVGFLGEWVLPGGEKAGQYDGRPGPAQVSKGFALLDYKAFFAKAEGWADAATDRPVANWRQDRGAREWVYCRFIDSRFAETPSFKQGGNTTLLEELADAGIFYELTSSKGTPLVFEGEELIVNALRFVPGWDKPEDGPQLFVCEDCRNIIDCLALYTGKDGTHGAAKDFIDLLRYAFLARLCDVGAVRESLSARRKPMGYGASSAIVEDTGRVDRKRYFQEQ